MINPESADVYDINIRVKRILCRDTDETGFSIIGKKDPVIANLQKLQPGLRPVLYNSPYKAAARAIIGHQLPVKYAAAISIRYQNNLAHN